MVAALIILGGRHATAAVNGGKCLQSILDRQPRGEKKVWGAALAPLLSERLCVHHAVSPQTGASEPCGKVVGEGRNGWLCWYHDRMLLGPALPPRPEKAAPAEKVFDGRFSDELDALAAEEAEVLAELLED